MTERSLTDWLEHAVAAGEPAERVRCVEQAIALAGDGWSWRRIVEAVAGFEPPDLPLLRRVIDGALAAAMVRPDVWCFREVARARAVRLDDRAGAREALERAIVAFDADPYGGSAWTLVADGFVELGDEDGARRALEHGCDKARARRSVDDLAHVARAFDKLGDHQVAVARAYEAEAMLAGGVAGAWGLANAWHELARPADAVRVLESATDGAAGTRDALMVARAWVHHGGAAGQPRALARAEALAASLADWLAIGEAAHDLGRDDLCRRALEQALPLATDDDQRGQVAAGYARWLGDAAAADAIGPRGVRPEALLAGAVEVAGWAPDPATLFDGLRARVPQKALERIAAADYGMAYDQHLAALTDIVTTGLVPRRLDWHPREVVELRRWSDGEEVDHLERALCVTLLCLAAEPALDVNGAILVESVVALGPQAATLATGLVAWCDARWRADCVAAGVDADHDPWALVTLAVLAAALDPDDARLPPLVAAIAAHDRAGELAADLAGSLRARLWRTVLDRHVAPHAARVPALAALLALLLPSAAG